MHLSQNCKFLPAEALYLAQQMYGIIFTYNGVLSFVGNVIIFGVDNRESNNCENKHNIVLVFI